MTAETDFGGGRSFLNYARNDSGAGSSPVTGLPCLDDRSEAAGA